MSRSSHRRRASGAVVALTAMLCTVMGVPTVLAWAATRPVAAPAWERLTGGIRALQAFGRPIDDGEVMVAVVVLGSVTWAWIMVCLVVDLASRVRGVATPALPASASLQRVVGVAVSLALTFAVPAARAGALSPSGSGPLAPAAAARWTGHGPTSPSSAVAATRSSGGPRTGRSWFATETTTTTAVPSLPGTGAAYTVKPGDTLWSIAEAQLGNPLRWRAIAAANVGRPQPDGRSLLDDNWILPGWILVLPAAATQGAPTGNVPPGGAPTAAVSTATTAAPAEPSRPVASPKGTFPSEGIPAAGKSDRPSPGGLDRTAGVGHLARPADPVVAFVEFGLLAGAVVAALDRMRRAQQRHRRTGLRIALPTGDVAALELDLRRRARGSPRPALQQVYAAVGVARQHVGPVMVAWAAIGDTEAHVGIEGGVDGIPPVPPPFVGHDVAGRWALPISAGAVDGSAGGVRRDLQHDWASVPATVVTAGRAGDELVVVDLAVVGAMAVEGSSAEAVCRSMVVELATSTDADDVELLVVDGDRAMAALERVRLVDGVDQALHLVSSRQHIGAGWSGGHVLDDARPPVTVVIVLRTEPWPHASTDALVQLALASRGTLAVVLTGPAASPRWRLCRNPDGTTTLQACEAPVGARPVAAGGIEPQMIDAETAGTIAALIDTAVPGPGVVPGTPPYDRSGGGSAGERTGNAGPVPVDEPGDRQVEVRVLGPVAVVGAERPFTRAWTLDLVVYLALHPAGATTEQWATALWPDRLMAPATLHSTASAARRALGRDATGEDHLPRSHGRLRLGPGVVTDWGLVQRWAGSDEPEAWRRALALVRGRPLDGLRAVDWALLDGLLPAIEATVVDLAERMGLWCLEEGDAVGATWAARRGLLVCPYDERLYRVLLRAADMAGNPAAVEAAMAELVRLVAEDVEPYDAVHPETLELYRALSRRGVRAPS